MFIVNALCAGVRGNRQQWLLHGGLLHICGRGVVDGGGTAPTSVSAPCPCTFTPFMHHCSAHHAMVSVRGGVLVIGGMGGDCRSCDNVWVLADSVRVCVLSVH